MATGSGKSMFEQALDVLPDGILLIGPDRRVVYSNAAFAAHWRIPDDILALHDDLRLLDFVQEQVVDPAAFVEAVNRITPTHDLLYDEIVLKDGRILSRRSLPFDTDGAFAARLWIFTDVTELRFARTDALCGIANRRAYATDFPVFVKAPRDGFVRSVGLIDVDNFKAYNDLYGHAAGDLVLQRVADLLRRRLSGPDDHVFRIGGEEFLMACRLPTQDEAAAFFEAIRTGIAELAMPHAGNAPENRITVSIGLDVFEGAEDAASVFQRADAALYRAKRGGRNRTENADRRQPVSSAFQPV